MAVRLECWYQRDYGTEASSDRLTVFHQHRNYLSLYDIGDYLYNAACQEADVSRAKMLFEQSAARFAKGEFWNEWSRAQIRKIQTMVRWRLTDFPHPNEASKSRKRLPTTTDKALLLSEALILTTLCQKQALGLFFFFFFLISIFFYPLSEELIFFFVYWFVLQHGRYDVCTH